MKIPVVNEQDELIEYKERLEINPTDVYRVSGLWVTDKEGNTLLAQRAFTKKHDPGLWGPAVAGTVEEGETYDSNVIKEAEEEIGLKNIQPILGPKLRRSTKNQYFVQWFSVVVDHNYPFVKSDEEVEQIKWFSKEELNNLLRKKPEIFLPNFDFYIEYFNK